MMPNYTEEQIHSMSGRELDAAVEWLCFKRAWKMSGTGDPRGWVIDWSVTKVLERPGLMPYWSADLNLAVTLMGEGGPLAVYDWMVGRSANFGWHARLWKDNPKLPNRDVVIAEGQPAEAICRATCIVLLREN